SSFYARNALEQALVAVRDMRAPPADRAHAAFTVRFYASVAELGGLPLDDGAARSIEPASYLPMTAHAEGNLSLTAGVLGCSLDQAIDSLDRAIADTPDEATRVVLAGWLAGLG